LGFAGDSKIICQPACIPGLPIEARNAPERQAKCVGPGQQIKEKASRDEVFVPRPGIAGQPDRCPPRRRHPRLSLLSAALAKLDRGGADREGRDTRGGDCDDPINAGVGMFLVDGNVDLLFASDRRHHRRNIRRDILACKDIDLRDAIEPTCDALNNVRGNKAGQRLIDGLSRGDVQEIGWGPDRCGWSLRHSARDRLFEISFSSAHRSDPFKAPLCSRLNLKSKESDICQKLAIQFTAKSGVVHHMP
jgi:hypothetical protein